MYLFVVRLKSHHRLARRMRESRFSILLIDGVEDRNSHSDVSHLRCY